MTVCEWASVVSVEVPSLYHGTVPFHKGYMCLIHGYEVLICAILQIKMCRSIKVCICNMYTDKRVILFECELLCLF